MVFFEGIGCFSFFFLGFFVTLGVGGGNENEFTVKWGLDLQDTGSITLIFTLQMNYFNLSIFYSFNLPKIKSN